MTRKVQCPICRTDGLAGQWDRPKSMPPGEWFECKRCGKFLMTSELSEELWRSQPPWWFRLSAWVRERQERGEPYPTIEGTPEEIEAWLLQLIERRSESIGSAVALNHEEIAPLIWARHREEVKALLRHLRDLDRIEFDAAPTGGAVRLRPEGLFRLEELAKSDVLNDQVFVAMWFPAKTTPEYAKMQAAYNDGIAKAIEAAGFKPWRVDLESRGERIDAQVMVDIRRSRAMVADATGHRPSVTYEAGLAEGLGKPVIWTVHEDWFKGLPFDTRQFPHLEWKTPEQLAKDLRPVIEHRLRKKPT
jgi:hypothetical protein